MEGLKSLGRSTGVTQTLPLFLRPRHTPDVPEDVMEHLNDPNYDLRSLRRASTSTAATEFDENKFPITPSTATLDISGKGSIHEKGSDYDAESHSDAYSQADGSNSRSSAIDFHDESPYPEVRAAVATIDDPLMPVNTFRMWLLGIFFAALISSLNEMLSLRYPSVLVTGIVIQLLALPAGKGLAKILPSKRFRVFGYSWSLNPGPFNIKEHVVVTVMANIVVYGVYSADIAATQKFYYHRQATIGYQLILALGTQLPGFAFSGILRRFIVWPSSMIWPGALVNAALFNALNKNFGKKETKHISRQKFFFIALACSFTWYWIPGYLWTGLSIFNWVCWIAPANVVVNQLFGNINGLGWSIITFDWAIISFIGSPLVAPWWAEANTICAMVIFAWVVCPILYFSNAWYGKFMPIMASAIYDNTGAYYNQTAIVDSDGFFVEAKYKAYSPLFLPTGYLMTYAFSLASITAIIVHIFLWYRHDLVRRLRGNFKDDRDIHSRLMRVYPEVPDWWYASLGVVTTIFLLVAVAVYHTDLPIYIALLAMLLAFVMSIPMGMIQAITNQSIQLNVFFELIGGYVVPGKPLANMIIKDIGVVMPVNAVSFAGNLKLGHYMKIPPRIMFLAQITATTVSCFVVTFVQEGMFAHIEDMCTPDQKQGFICPGTYAFANASLIWGGIGPRRLFSAGAMYNPILWFFLIGAVSPIPFYFLARRYPLSLWRYVNMPVAFGSLGPLPIANPSMYAVWGLTGFIFNYVLRRHKFRWWMRYNYILSAALDGGVAFATIFIFLCVQLPKGGVTVNWWGNSVWKNTADAMGTPMYTLQPGETFGPSTWS